MYFCFPVIASSYIWASTEIRWVIVGHAHTCRLQHRVTVYQLTAGDKCEMRLMQHVKSNKSKSHNSTKTVSVHLSRRHSQLVVDPSRSTAGDLTAGVALCNAGTLETSRAAGMQDALHCATMLAEVRGVGQACAWLVGRGEAARGLATLRLYHSVQ